MADNSGLTGTAPAVAIATTQQGGWYNSPHVDARRTALNTNDLRGKILRITVAPDGSYTVPDGNLFEPAPRDPAGDLRHGLPQPLPDPARRARSRLHHRLLSRLADAAALPRPPGHRPRPGGREPANYGWPLCVQPDLPYFTWDFNTSTTLDNPPKAYDCDDPPRARTTRPAGTPVCVQTPPVEPVEHLVLVPGQQPGRPCPGRRARPRHPGPAGDTCPQLFPELGIGGVGPHGAAPYDFDADNPNPTKFPEYWDGSFVLGEFTRDFLREVRLDSQGNIFKINNTLPCGAGAAAGRSSPATTRWTSSSTTTAPSTC